MASNIMKEFRAFAVKGNVIDLAVGVIIGGAFGKIVDSLVNDIVMPLISSLLGGRIDFTNLFIVLGTVPDNVPRTFDALDILPLRDLTSTLWEGGLGGIRLICQTGSVPRSGDVQKSRYLCRNAVATVVAAVNTMAVQPRNLPNTYHF
jgi:hypothetical protein